MVLLLFGANNFHHGSGQLVEPGPVTKTSSEAGHCRLTLDGGPGSLEGAIWIGWDNLVNEPMGPVFDITYDECRMTSDDKFLLPDGMSAISIKKIHLDRSASYYQDFQSYVQDNTQSINLDVSAGGMGDFGEVSISGSYSHTHQEIKKNFQSEQSTMLHTKLNYHAYDLPNQLGERLHPEFMVKIDFLLQNQYFILVSMKEVISNSTLTLGTETSVSGDPLYPENFQPSASSVPYKYKILF